jgi:endo-1,3-1,4-beta-glycanase ExoK
MLNKLTKRTAALLGTALALMLSACDTTRAPSASTPTTDAVTTQARPKPTTTTGTKWVETFDRLDTSRWVVSSWGGFWQQSGLSGTFTPQNAAVNGKGQLVLTLKIEACATGLCAQAGELQSHQRMGFGRYTYRMRAASTSSDPAVTGTAQPGNISGAFSYYQDSTTEIDVEIEGHRSSTLNAAVWKGLNTKSYAVLPTGSNLAQGFHDYTYEWRSGRITYFIDGVKIWETTQNVPQAAAHLMLNVWPTLTNAWGGEAKPGTVYMLVDSVTFEPF